MKPFLACADWGTTSFRLWLLTEDGAVLAERRSDEGLMAARDKGGFETVLETNLEALGAPAALPVVLCGMVGARSGWVEAAYLDTPLALGDLGAHATPVPAARRKVVILPGVAQRAKGDGVAQRVRGQADVMRGEETKLCGLELGDGLVIMPGTHCKWAAIEGGRLTGFATFMTGEIFAALSAGERSVLREAVAGGDGVPDEAAFEEGVREALERPELVLNALFCLRAAWLLEGRPAAETRARLSGLLVGLECAGARTRFGQALPVTIVAEAEAARRHASALRLAGWAEPDVADADTAVRAGLLLAGRRALADGRAAA